MQHKKPTRKRMLSQPKKILEWMAVLTAVLTPIKLLVEILHLLI